jgi:hypothetical protein
MKNVACTVVATVEMDASVRTEDGLTLVEVLEREAFRRGAEAMREAAAKRLDAQGINNVHTYGNIVRATPVPEDK